MTELEKMQSGKWYDANFDQDLLTARYKAKSLCDKLNQIPHDQLAQRDQIICDIFQELPQGLVLLSPFQVDFGVNIKLGKNVFINHYCYFMDGAPITIGNSVFIGPYCGFYTATHPLTFRERNKGLEKANPIVIGNNCWIGSNVSIMPGVTIGSGCVIGTGAVVTKDLPSNSVAMGIPAEVVSTIDQI